MEMAEALQAANELDIQRQAVGFDQATLDEAARRGFGNGAFEDSEEDVGAIIDEYFSSPAPAPVIQDEAAPTAPNSLASKLEILATQNH